MKSKNLCSGVMIIVAFIILSAVPRVLNYQGKLLDSSGVGVNDTLALTFRLYTTETGGSPIWEETISDVVVRQGLFSVELAGFPDTVDFSTQYWLEVVVDGEAMSPRERLTSAPYSIHAGTADRGYNPVYSEANPTRRRGEFVFRAGAGATLSDDGGTINITLGRTETPTLADVLAVGRSANDGRIVDLADPVNPQDAATKAYVDARTENPNWLALINRDRGAGAGLSFAGDSFSINVDNSTIEISGDAIRLKESGVGARELAPSGVVAGTYTTANITVDEDGRITFAENGRTGVQGNGSQNYIAKWVADSTVGNSIIYDNGTYVGVGNTNPQAKLDVSGTIKGGGVLAGIWAAQPVDGCISTSSTSWTDVPGLTVTFSLDRPATIFFTYSINVQPNSSPGSNWLGTRIVLDDTPYYESGSHFQPFCSGDCNIQITGNLVRQLSSGSHTAKLQWKVTSSSLTWQNCTTGWGDYIGGRNLIAIAFYQ